jgi:glycosyltransferase involved in cell wall biosynthesis
MRILYVARRYWPAVGGVETYLRKLATELGSRHELTVLAGRIDDGEHTRLTDSLRPPEPFEPFEDGPVTVKPLRVPVRRRMIAAPLIAHVTPGLRRYAYGRTRPLAASLLARAVAPSIAEEARGADVIHMWAGDLLASAAVRAGELAGVPVVITPFAHRGQWGYDSASLRAYGTAARTIALLETEAHLYEEFGIDRARIDVLGVCSAGIPPIDRVEARRRLEIDGPLVLFLGARREYKGFDLLLQAAPAVSAAHPATTFAFVGPGPALSDLPADSRVLDVGAVDEDQKALWLNAADLVCLPSAAEILPGSILEAWSVGTPVLTSDIPPLVELVTGADAGRYASRDPEAIARTLVEMLDDPDELRQMGARGRAAWQQRFTLDVVARRHEETYALARSSNVGQDTDSALLAAAASVSD